MMVSTKGRYALRVMIDLAENGDGNYKNVIASDTYPFKLTKGSTTGSETLMM